MGPGFAPLHIYIYFHLYNDQWPIVSSFNYKIKGKSSIFYKFVLKDKNLYIKGKKKGNIKIKIKKQEF